MTTRYEAAPLAGRPLTTTSGDWAVLDTLTDDYVEAGPQDNLTTWVGTRDQAEDYAARLNAADEPDKPLERDSGYLDDKPEDVRMFEAQEADRLDDELAERLEG